MIDKIRNEAQYNQVMALVEKNYRESDRKRWV